MKTLILNGSPRKNGDTAALTDMLKKNLSGEIIEVSAYHADISPCVDCRFCRTHSGCAINDDMQTVYETLRSCDNVVIASPIYFSEITGRLLDVCSRLQTLYCGRFFRGETPPEYGPKKGGIILAGGGDGSPDKAISTSRALLHQMGCTEIFEPVLSLSTETISAGDDPAAAEGILSLSAYLLKDFSKGE